MIFYSSFRWGEFGNIFVASTEKGVCMVDFLTTEASFLQRLRMNFRADAVRDDGRNEDTIEQLERYLSGTGRYFHCSLDLKGTSFQKMVWQEVRKIPYGETRSYQQVARAIGCPNAQRAVGNANSANLVPIIIPCHRVIRSDGSLGGYGHGADAKKRLLRLEKAIGSG